MYERMDYLNQNIEHIHLTMAFGDLEKLLEKIIRNRKSFVGEIQYFTEFESLPPVFMDASYFTEAVENMLNNAEEVLSEEIQEEKRIYIRTMLHHQWIIVSISDNGRGMTREEQKRIFTPFYSSKPAKQNWGIGLPICHNIIRAHNGKIIVKSRPGKGTQFEILLPNVFPS